MNDPIVEEVRAVRAHIAEACNYNLARMLELARATTEEFPGFKRLMPADIAARRNRQSGDDVSHRRP